MCLREVEAMAPFNWLVIDPTEEAFLIALAEAARTASDLVVAAAGGLPIARDLCTLTAERQTSIRLFRQVVRRPEGSKRWRGKRVSNWPVAQLVAAWWTDAIGRRHVRIRGFAHLQILEAPPLAEVHPERVVVRQRGKETDVLGVCPCGLCGSLAGLAWMGNGCGPCHDRKIEGSAVEPIDVLHAPNDDPQAPAIGLDFLPDGRTLLANDRRFVRRWNLGDGTVETLWEAHDSRFENLVVHPDGERVYSAEWGNSRSRVACRFLTDGSVRELPIPDHHQHVIALSPDGAALVVGSSEEWFRVDLQSGRIARLERPGFNSGERIEFTADGTRLFILTGVGGIHVCPASGGKSTLVTQSPDNRYHHRKWKVSANRRLFAIRRGEDPRVIDLWSEEAGWRAVSQEGGSGTYPHICYALSCDGNVMAVGDEEGHLHFWDAANGDGLATLHGLGTPHDSGARIAAMSFSPDGQTLAVASHDGTLRLWPWRQLLDA
jgi:hypothetical protein